MALPAGAGASSQGLGSSASAMVPTSASASAVMEAGSLSSAGPTAEATTCRTEPAFGVLAPSGLNCLAATGDFRWVYTGGDDGVVRRYDFFASINGEQELPRTSPLQTVCNSSGVLLGTWLPWGSSQPPQVRALCAHSQGLWAVVGSSHGHVQLATIRVNEGTAYHSVQAHTDSVSDLTLLPGEFACLSASLDTTIALHDLNTGQCSTIQSGRSHPHGHKSQVTSINMQPHAAATTALSSSLDGTARLWDLRTTECRSLAVYLRSPGDRPPPLLTATWGIGGAQVYTAQADGRVVEWDLRQQGPVRSVLTPAPTGVTALCILHGQIVCGTAEGSVLVYAMDQNWEAKHPKYTLLRGERGTVSSIITDAEYRFLLVSSGTRGMAGQAANSCLGYDLTDLLKLPPSTLEQQLPLSQ
eukprot:m.383875 g.383875  ORF g.383875 m.383875 type:complete len:414 (+) comp20047_c1_seq22:3432-4673(+)